MFKYIVKRLGVSLIVLFGVSVILYSLVRMMPVDYITQKFSSQISQGTMTMEDIDEYKKLYGLYNPEAELRLIINNGESEYNGTYTKDTTKVEYSYVENTTGVDEEELKDNKVNALKMLIAPSTANDTETTTYTASNSEYKLDLICVNNTSYTYKLYREYYELKDTKTDEDGTVHRQYEKKTTNFASGSFDVDYDVKTNTFSLKLYTNKTKYIESGFSFYTFNIFQRFGTILSGYFNWLGKLFQGDLGTSWKYERPVGDVIADYMWISFAIAIVATILQFLIAIPLGITSATHQYTARDYIVTIFTMIGISLPTYFFAAILIKVFAVDLGWFPTSGLNSSGVYWENNFAGWWAKLGDTAHHLVLPIFCSVILSLGGLMRYTRTNMLEVLSADYIRTARAKGLSEKKVIYKHAFRNTMIPLVTLLAGILPSLFGGMMITEQVFGIPGIGNKAYTALTAGDIPFVMGYNMFLAILSVLGTLFSDLMYSVVDPRVKIGK